MKSKRDLAAAMAVAHLDLPDNWSKMTTARAQACVDENLKPKATVARLGAAILGAAVAAGGAAKAMLGLGEAVADLNDATARTGPPEGYVRKTLLNPGWARLTGGNRGWRPSYPSEGPSPASRQVERQNERRSAKMPIGFRQVAWHELKGFGKINEKAA